MAVTIGYRIFVAGLLGAIASLTGGRAEAAAACSPFTSFPLVLNFGTGANSGTGEDLNCAMRKVQAAVNSAAVLRPTIGVLALKGVGQLDTSLSTRNGASPETYLNPNAVVGLSGNQVSFCPALSCLAGGGDGAPSNDHQRASLLVSATTQDDGHSEEQTLAVVTTINTGLAIPWGTSKAFPAGANTSANGQIYRTTNTCTSAGSGGGPSGLALSGIIDGSCSWGWINAGAINAKVGLYVETKVMPGAGSAWGAAFNYHFTNDPTIPGGFWPGVEFDYANDSGKDCVLGTADCTSLRVGIAGNGQITHGMQITGDGFVRAGAQRNSMIWGLRINGEHSVQEAAIELDTQAKVGIGFGASGIGTTAHSVATIKDASTSPIGYDMGGSHVNGLALSGAFTGAQIVGNNFTVFPDGGLTAKNFNAGAVPGVSCSGVPTSNFQVTNGIVTRC